MPSNSTPAQQPAGAAVHSPELSEAEHVCLALVVQGVSHGWAIGTLLLPDDEIGRIWTLSRPLTYRAITGLVDKGMVSRQGPPAGSGRDRTLLEATAAGSRATTRWLDTPVEHLRDVRTELLVKLTLRTRAGLDNGNFLAAQQRVFEPAIDALSAATAGDDLVELWRRESARAVRRFLNQALHPPELPEFKQPEMRLSARNQLRGTVVAVQRTELMASIKAVLGDGQPLTALITRESADDLDIAVGDDVLAIVKSTEVMVAKPS